MVPFLLLLGLHVQPQPGAPAYKQPQLASAFGQVAMVFGSEGTIYFSASADQGRTFSAPVTVATASKLALGRHRGPRVTILKDAILVSAVVGEEESHEAHAHGTPADGDLIVWRSTDRGKTWSRAARVNDVPRATREGLFGIAANSKGEVAATWLDLRGKGTQLYSSRSTDGGRTWSKNSLVYNSPSGSICECCAPSIAFDQQGTANLMWRNSLDGSRDFYTAESKDGERFSPALREGTGTWKLKACPMDGGSLVSSQGKLYSVFRREHDVYLAQPGFEKQLGSGMDVTAAGTNDGVYAAWTNSGHVELLSPDAKAPMVLGPGSFPNLTALRDGAVVAAWESDGSIQVERIAPKK